MKKRYGPKRRKKRQSNLILGPEKKREKRIRTYEAKEGRKKGGETLFPYKVEVRGERVSSFRGHGNITMRGGLSKQGGERKDTQFEEKTPTDGKGEEDNLPWRGSFERKFPLPQKRRIPSS